MLYDYFPQNVNMLYCICIKSHRSNEGASYFTSHPPDSKLNFESLFESQ